MCRNQKDVDTRIHNMCMAAKTNEEDMLELGGKYLGIFRDVCRQTTINATDVVNDLCSHVTDCRSTCSMEETMSDALADLLFFASESEQEKYNSRISDIVQTSLLIRLKDELKVSVYSFSEYGPEFVNILSICYMNTFDYTEDDILYTLNKGRSTFYKKKRRAIILFGLAIRGFMAKRSGNRMDYIVQTEGVQYLDSAVG